MKCFYCSKEATASIEKFHTASNDSPPTNFKLYLCTDCYLKEYTDYVAVTAGIAAAETASAVVEAEIKKRTKR